MSSPTTAFDVADYLDSPEIVAAYLTEALETGESELVAAALGAIARAKGMTQVARDSGLGRESLYKALSKDGHPGFDTVLKVLNALGLSLTARSMPEPKRLTA